MWIPLPWTFNLLEFWDDLYPLWLSDRLLSEVCFPRLQQWANKPKYCPPCHLCSQKHKSIQVLNRDNSPPKPFIRNTKPCKGSEGHKKAERRNHKQTCNSWIWTTLSVSSAAFLPPHPSFYSSSPQGVGKAFPFAWSDSNHTTTVKISSFFLISLTNSNYLEYNIDCMLTKTY